MSTATKRMINFRLKIHRNSRPNRKHFLYKIKQKKYVFQ